MRGLYRLDIDEILENISLFTEYDIGGEGHGIIVEGHNLDSAISQIVNDFKSLIEDSFKPYDEMEEE